MTAVVYMYTVLVILRIAYCISNTKNSLLPIAYCIL